MKSIFVAAVALGLTATAHAQDDKRVFLQVHTGTTYVFGTDSDAIVRDLQAQWRDRLVVSYVHHDDAMTFDGNPSEELDVRAFPTATVDGGELTSRSAWADLIEDRMELPRGVNLSVQQHYDPSDRTLEVTATAVFEQPSFMPTRMRLLVLEDGVVGQGFGYDQANARSNEVGHLYEGTGNPIYGFEHDFTLRAYPIGLQDNGAIDGQATVGQVETESWEVTLPGTWHEDRMTVAVYLTVDDPAFEERRVWHTVEAPLGAVPTFDIERADYVVELGTVDIGATADAPVRIRNVGDVRLDVGAVPGFDAPELAWTEDTCSDAQLEPHESCTLTVAYSPTDSGAVSELLDVPYANLAGDTILVRVSGIAVGLGADDTDTDSDTEPDTSSSGGPGCHTVDGTPAVGGLSLALMGLLGGRRRRRRGSR